MISTRSLSLGTLAALAALSGPAVATVDAQYLGYFGRNKVQYESFDFHIIRTEHFDVYYYESEEEAAEMAARMAERWYARLSRVLDHEFRNRQPIILYANHPHFEQTNATPQQIGETTGGFTEILKRRIVLPMAGPLGETDHVLGHELVHAFQFDMTGQGPSAVGVDVPGAIRLPLWFIEGMAEYLSLGPVDPFTSMWLRDAVRNDDFPSLSDLNNPRYFPYRFGHALWSFIAGQYGEDKIPRILQLAGRSGNAAGAIQAVLEVPADTFSARWKEAVETYYEPLAEDTREPGDFGRLVISEDNAGGSVNLGPALSPDGSQLVFLSERGLFSVEMYLADARTGEVKRRLTRTVVDPHYESLQFASSSGSWHPDGERFAFSGVVRGKPVVTVVDVSTGRKVQEVRLERLGEIFTPVWAPDGRRIAFAANVNGFVDLFLLDMETEELTRLTDDPFADLQPAWHPDGRRLAFVTDRFDTDLETLTAGPYRLASYDVDTGRIEALPGFSEGRNFDPHWSPDGQSLYFVSDHGGIANVYRLEVEEARIHRVTNLWTGASGISQLSPALSIASRTGELAMGVNRGGPFTFEIYVLDDEQVLAGEPVSEALPAVDPGVLPPRERLSLELVGLLDDPDLGLPDPVTFERDEYSPALSLDFVSQPTLAVGASDFGVFFAGGATLFFSDMLGDHSLTTLIQINSARGDLVKGTAALAGYQNQSSRWNWGIVGGQVPIVTRFFRQGFAVSQQDTLAVLQLFRFFEINREATGVIAYPFNRAQRAEFSLSARSVDFALQVDEVAVNRFGQVVFDRRRDLPDCETDEQGLLTGELCAPSTMNMVSGSAALVYDNSIFGGTSPILGQRYRVEARPTVGSLTYISLLGDYRRYFLIARPLNLAARVLHFGRYGGDSEDARLRQLFVGYPHLVRGYDAESFDVRRECRDPGGPFFSCPVFDQLLGSRIAAANLELRLPVLGGIGLLSAPGFPPTEIGGFFDTGVAWTRDQGPSFLGGSRKPVRSVGGFLRMNLFGFAIAEIDLVNPLDRPERDWFWTFSLQPGF